MRIISLPFSSSSSSFSSSSTPEGADYLSGYSPTSEEKAASLLAAWPTPAAVFYSSLPSFLSGHLIIFAARFFFFFFYFVFFHSHTKVKKRLYEQMPFRH